MTIILLFVLPAALTALLVTRSVATDRQAQRAAHAAAVRAEGVQFPKGVRS